MSHLGNHILHKIISLHREVAEVQYLWQSEDKVKVGKAINSSADIVGEDVADVGISPRKCLVDEKKGKKDISNVLYSAGFNGCSFL